jgi:hypothetical protein
LFPPKRGKATPTLWLCKYQIGNSIYLYETHG